MNNLGESKLVISRDIKDSLCVSDINHTFENFQPGEGTQVMKKIFRDFAETLQPTLLLCWGGIGNGKTYMLEATAIRLYHRGIFARVMLWNRFRGALINSMRNNNSIPSYEQILQNYCRSKILLLDDYGMGTKDSDWERSVLEELINYRYREGLLTAMTTNLKVGELPERVVSRFSEIGIGVVVENKGGDYRRRK